MVARILAILVLAVGLAACSGPSKQECEDACNAASARCPNLDRDECTTGCADEFDDDDLSCLKGATTCDEMLSCHHAGLCARLCGDAGEKCGRFTEGCTNDCRDHWSYDAALCVDEARTCGDLFLCVSL